MKRDAKDTVRYRRDTRLYTDGISTQKRQGRAYICYIIYICGFNFNTITFWYYYNYDIIVIVIRYINYILLYMCNNYSNTF